MLDTHSAVKGNFGLGNEGLAEEQVRLFSGLLTICAVAAAGFACGALVLAIYPSPETLFEPPERAVPREMVVAAPTNAPGEWPEVFGVVPEIAPEPAPEPEIAEEPPQENTTYWLTGLVAGRGDDSWAMISENDRGLVVRVGDKLIGGEIVTAIDARGVWIERDGVKELIALQKSDLEALATRGEEDEGVTVSISDIPVSDSTIVVEAVDADYIRSLLGEAGNLNGDQVITAVTPGRVFEQIGLREGDRITGVNGNPLQSGDVLADIAGEDLASGLLELEIQRDGARHSVKVHFEAG